MPKPSRGIAKTRRIFSIGSLAVAAGSDISVPVGAKLLSVKGEADNKPTYDFTVTLTTYTSNGSSVANNIAPIRYVGTPNGMSVKCGRDFPLPPSVVTAPAPSTFNNGPAAYRIQITAGTGVTLQVYFITGPVSLT